MSETSNTQETQETQVKEKKECKGFLRTFIWVMIGVIIGIILGMATATTGLMDAANEISTSTATEQEVDESQDIDSDQSSLEGSASGTSSNETEKLETVELSGKDADEARERILKCISQLQNSNTYMQISTSETAGEIYIYNEHGECIAENSEGTYTAVFRNDNKAVKFDTENSTLAAGEDLEILSILSNVANAELNNDTIKMYKTLIPEDDNEYNMSEFIVELVGEDAVKSLYSSMSDAYVEQVMASLKEQAGEDWEPNLKFVFDISNTSDEFSAVCLVNQDGQDYTNWAMAGYTGIGTWKLDTKWYEDLSDITSEEYDEMYDKVISECQEAMKESELYTEDTDTEAEDDTTVTEGENAIESTEETDTETEETE